MKRIIYNNKHYLIKRNWEADQLKKGIVAIIVCMLLFVTVPAVTATETFEAIEIPRQPLAVVWDENFDSYANAQSLHGVNGWEGWENDSQWTAYVTDLYSNSAPNSVEIYDLTDLVYPFSRYHETTSGQWTLSCVVYIDSATFSGESYFILLTQYGTGIHNWAAQPKFDSFSGKLVSNEGAELDIIYDQWVEIRVEIDLEADIQQFYYGGDMLYEKSWKEGVSGGGAKEIAALDLFANGAEAVYYDDFILDGEPALEPEIVIGEVTAGIGITAVIENIGAGDATDVDWSIVLDGGLIILGGTSGGTISTLAAGASTEVKTGLVFGFGKPTITITAAEDSVEKSAFVLLFFVLGLS